MSSNYVSLYLHALHISFALFVMQHTIWKCEGTRAINESSNRKIKRFDISLLWVYIQSIFEAKFNSKLLVFFSLSYCCVDDCRFQPHHSTTLSVLIGIQIFTEIVFSMVLQKAFCELNVR